MPRPPLISVVIPCYNQARFLGAAIDSVRRSASPDVEIVVVDDGSTDDTADVARSFAEARCMTQPNAGVANARNRGLRESRGALIVFLDSDDCLAPGALDIGAAALAAKPAAAFVFGRCRLMAADGTLLPTPQWPRIERNHYRELLKRNHIRMTALAMFRREAVERAGGFDPAAHAAADYGLYLRLARTNPVHDHAQIVAYYRRHASNMSGDAGRMFRETLSVFRRERPFVEGDPALLAAYYEGWSNWQEFYGNHLVNEIRGDVRTRHWIRALRKAAVLGWLHPRGLSHHAVHKMALTLRPGARARRGEGLAEGRDEPAHDSGRPGSPGL